MKRNMRHLLTLWGNWARSEEACCSVDWPTLAPLIAMATPRRKKSMLSDRDGAIVDNAIAGLARAEKTNEVMVLGMYYIAGCNLRTIADSFDVSSNTALRMIERAENFIEGSLSWPNVSLECDVDTPSLRK